MKKTLLMLALAAGIASFAQNAQAELITINIGSTGFNIGGINGGYPSDRSAIISDFPISENSFVLHNDFNGILTGLEGRGGFTFAAGLTAATPVKFSPNASIGSGSSYTSGYNSLFKSGLSISPDFGLGSYMGFQTSQGNYGWLQVTWTASSEQFQILSGAYESRPNVAVLAGGAAPIPEPGTWAAMANFAGGAAFAGWRRRKSAKAPA